MKVRAIRGATTAKSNTSEAIVEATKELLNRIITNNEIKLDDICFILFSVTSDLDKAFPARAAREMGLSLVPLLDITQMSVETDLKRCIRVLLTVNTDKKLDEIKHVYLHDAEKLRPDLALDPFD